MRRVRLILFAVGSLVVQRPVYAQWQLSGDAGVSHLRQLGLPESNAATLGTTFDIGNERSFLTSSLLAARASGGEWTGQGVAFGALVDPSRRLFRWQLTGGLSAFGQDGARPTTSGELGAWLQTGSPLLGASVGVGTGASAHAEDITPVRRGFAGGWWTVGTERFDVDLALTRTRLQRFNAPSLGATYVDASAAWHHERGGVSLGASTGYRTVAVGPIAAGGWAAGDATLWFAPRTAFVLSVGQTMDDVVRGFPRASYASIAIRVVARPHVAVFQRSVPGPRIVARRQTSGALLIEVRAPDASTVELTADFTDWMPVALTRAGGVWRLERAVSPGSHRVTIRIDGGPWIVPPNLPKVEDDLGGSAGVITIPE
jgi:hypothetical protein